ncbi:MAG: hypothetical protein WB523_13550 [Candidatus Sulfotelmatobacter sp.]
MSFDLDKASRIIDLCLKAELHAIAMLCIGAGLVLHGQKELGSGVVMAALAIFKGNR